MIERYEHPFLDAKHGAYTWCLHCERVWATAEWVQNGWECPGEDCDGSPLDAWRWERVLEVNPEYPENPNSGEVWGMYGSGQN